MATATAPPPAIQAPPADASLAASEAPAVIVYNDDDERRPLFVKRNAYHASGTPTSVHTPTTPTPFRGLGAQVPDAGELFLAAIASPPSSVAEASLLENFLRRHSSGCFHTWAGPRIMIQVSSGAVPDDGDEPPSEMSRSVTLDLKWPLRKPCVTMQLNRTPRAGAIAEAVFTRALEQAAPQALLFTGEGGGAVTRELHLVLRHIFARASAGRSPESAPSEQTALGSSFDSAVLACCAALEPLYQWVTRGCEHRSARKVMRTGRMVRLHLDAASGAIIGACVTHLSPSSLTVTPDATRGTGYRVQPPPASLAVTPDATTTATPRQPNGRTESPAPPPCRLALLEGMLSAPLAVHRHLRLVPEGATHWGQLSGRFRLLGRSATEMIARPAVGRNASKSSWTSWNDGDDHACRAGEYGAWLDGLRGIGVSEEQAGECARVAAAMLTLSHIDLHQSADHAFAEVDDADGGNAAHLNACASLLRVNESSLVAALTTRGLTLGSSVDDENVRMPLTVAEARENRHALSASIHRLVLDWIQSRSDAALLSPTGSPDVSPTGSERPTHAAVTRVISLVEIPTLPRGGTLGDELDRLCTSLCWERTRAFLIDALRRPYMDMGPAAGGSPGSHIAATCALAAVREHDAAARASAAVLALLEGKPDGVLTAIERHARLTVAGGDGDLAATLSTSHSRSQRWRLTPEAFLVRHTGDEDSRTTSSGSSEAHGGWRTYRWHGLVREDQWGGGRPLHEVTRLLRTSSSSIVREVLEAPRRRQSALGSSSGACMSRCARMRLDLAALFTSLACSDVSLVACLRLRTPSELLAEGLADEHVAEPGTRSCHLDLLRQLRSLEPYAASSLANDGERTAAADRKLSSTKLPLLSTVRHLEPAEATEAAEDEEEGHEHDHHCSAERSRGKVTIAPLPSATNETPGTIGPPRPLRPAESRRVVASYEGGRQLLSSLMELRMWSRRGPIWAPFTCSLLSDDEVLLLHAEHPPYAASLTAPMITAVTAAPERAPARSLDESLDEDSLAESSAAGGGGGALVLTITAHGRDLVLRHPDDKVLERWERALSQRARLNSTAGPRSSTARMSNESQWAGASSAWKEGSLRLVTDDRLARGLELAASGDGPGVQVPLCKASLTHECVLHLTNTISGEELELPLASMLSARLLPPYRPVIEVVTSGSSRAFALPGESMQTENAPTARPRLQHAQPAESQQQVWLLCFESEDEVLSWLGMILILLPACKPPSELQPKPLHAARQSLPKKRPSLLAKRLSQRSPSSAVSKRLSAVLQRVEDRTARGRAADEEDLPESNVLVAGVVRMHVERGDGAQRWVSCHARLEVDGVLTLCSVDSWALRRRVLVRACTSLTRLGSTEWPYLRLQEKPKQALILAVGGGEDMLGQWEREIERVSGLGLITTEMAGWVELRVRRQDSGGAAAVARNADGAPTARLLSAATGSSTTAAAAAMAASAPEWRAAYCMLTSGRRLYWFASLHEPKPLGAIDMQSCSASHQASPGGHFSAPSLPLSGVDGSVGMFELQTSMSGMRVQLRSGEHANTAIDPWRAKLLQCLDECKRDVEAKRLINMNLRTSQYREDDTDMPSGRISQSARSGWASARLMTKAPLLFMRRQSAATTPLIEMGSSHSSDHTDVSAVHVAKPTDVSVLANLPVARTHPLHQGWLTRVASMVRDSEVSSGSVYCRLLDHHRYATLELFERRDDGKSDWRALFPIEVRKACIHRDNATLLAQLFGSCCGPPSGPATRFETSGEHGVFVFDAGDEANAMVWLDAIASVLSAPQPMSRAQELRAESAERRATLLGKDHGRMSVSKSSKRAPMSPS